MSPEGGKVPEVERTELLPEDPGEQGQELSPVEPLPGPHRRPPFRGANQEEAAAATEWCLEGLVLWSESGDRLSRE